MYREDLLKEISSALSTHSDLDYDVATIVAQKYIDIRQAQSQEDALEYYSHRKEDISESEKIERGIYFSNEIGLDFYCYSPSSPTLPTTFIIMGRPLPYCGLCDFPENFNNPQSHSAEFSKTQDYTFVFKYLASPGVRGIMPNGIPTSFLSHWGITPIFMGSEGYGKPDTIREKVSHLTKIPKLNLIKYLDRIQ